MGMARNGSMAVAFVLGLLSLMSQLFFWSEVVPVNHQSAGSSE